MTHPIPYTMAITLSVLVLACGETPTQPGTAGNPALAAKSSAVASNTWTAKAPPLFGPDEVFAGTAPNSAGQSMVYVFGGHIGQGSGVPIQAYDLATDTWTVKSTVVYESASNGVGTIGGELYFSGGFQISDLEHVVPLLYAYEPALDRLTRKADMPRPTADGVTGVIHGKLYVLTGICSDDGPPVFDCEPPNLQPYFYRYDPATDTWTSLASAPRFHVNGAGGVIHGKFYVAGGAGTADLDVYDPKTNTWTALAPMPAAGVGVGAVLHNKLFVVIGPEFTGLPGQALERQTFAYDPVSNTWETEAPYPTESRPWAAARVTLHGHDHLLTVGGRHPDGIVPDDIGVPNASQLYTP
jgi:N-acetylneuraminic acid mutarotase